MRYIVVTEDELALLVETVQANIRLGWRPLGGVAVISVHYEAGLSSLQSWNERSYFQAMTFEDGEGDVVVERDEMPD